MKTNIALQKSNCGFISVSRDVFQNKEYQAKVELRSAIDARRKRRIHELRACSRVKIIF